MKPSIFLFLLFVSFGCTGGQWLTGFRKPAKNPVLTADSSYTFFCPVEQKTVRWQLADVFNPAAVTRNDSIFLLFRAEDNPAAAIGGRTSRIGLAPNSHCCQASVPVSASLGVISYAVSKPNRPPLRPFIFNLGYPSLRSVMSTFISG